MEGTLERETPLAGAVQADKFIRHDQPLRENVPQDHAPTTTVIFISNLHCPSCASSIEDALLGLNPRPVSSSVSFILHSLEVVHDPFLRPESVVSTLEELGFEVHSVFQDIVGQGHSKEISVEKKARGQEWEQSLEASVERWRRLWWPSEEEELAIEMGKREKHVQQCADCRESELDGEFSSTEVPLVTLKRAPKVIEDTKSQYSVNIDPVADREKSDAGSLRQTNATPDKNDAFVKVEPADIAQTYTAELSIEGMTCAACVASITESLKENFWIQSVDVSLLTNSAKVVFQGKHRADEIASIIEDAGFEAKLESVQEVKSVEPKQKQIAQPQSQSQSDLWRCQYVIGGMTCAACVSSVTESVQELPWVESVDINLLSNSGTIVFRGKEYLEEIGKSIEEAGFDATLDTVVNIGQEVEEVEQQRNVSIRIDGMYCHQCPFRITEDLEQAYGDRIKLEKQCTVNNPILTITYSPKVPEFTVRHILQFITEINPAFKPAIYRPPTIEDRAREIQNHERRRILFRLTLSVTIAIPAFIIGVVCMNLLSMKHGLHQFMMQPMWAGNVGRAEWALFILATPVYFFCADVFHRKAIKEIKALWKPGSRTPILRRFYRFGSMNMLMSLGTSIAYFSSIAELAIAATEKRMRKSMASMYFDSVIFLTMFLLIGRFLEAYSKARTGDAVTALGKLRPTEALLVDQDNATGRKIAVDLLEIGDTVKVPHGSSPPFDGILLDVEAKFDESSLTGESRLVTKKIGETVYSGTVNKSGPVSIRINSVSGTSMLDQIIKVVREGQTKRAPVERAADIITGHFVPFVVLVGIITFVVWLSLGLAGALPASYLDSGEGGWALWALRFAIAVFVIACPCGIGLAAPTAMFVGGGMAAQHGILVKGGGEAFQEASTLDCIVFDKTGTLTQGGDPCVTDYEYTNEGEEAEILACVRMLEESSSHPVAKAIATFCAQRSSLNVETNDIEELPGKGIKGSARIRMETMDVLIGNERLMSDFNVLIPSIQASTLIKWKEQGKSIALAATRSPSSSAWTLTSFFAISDALRPEAASIIRSLQSRNIAVWMLSGDNPITAQAVGAQVGIHPDSIIAGVLPEQKAQKIQYLQKTLPKKRGKSHATVAMVGDGINDSPALTMADVGIAIGSGSDVAISSASFILVSSNLTSLLTLIDLSRTVFRRVWFNFGWALIYNCIAMPVAAGVLYPVMSKGQHVRLDPVWAALAMALSSVSVVCSSLLLRSPIPGVGFRALKSVSGK